KSPIVRRGMEPIEVPLGGEIVQQGPRVYQMSPGGVGEGAEIHQVHVAVGNDEYPARGTGILGKRIPECLAQLISRFLVPIATAQGRFQEGRRRRKRHDTSPL